MQKIFNLEALRSIEVNGNTVCLNGAYRVDTPEWVNDRRAALEKAAKLARNNTPPKEKEDDKNVTPIPNPADAETTPTATGDTEVTESTGTPTEPANGDEDANADANTDADESQEIDSDTDEEIETPETETVDEVEDDNEDPVPAREVTVEFKNCKDAELAKTTIPYGSNIYDVFKKLVETNVYDGMVTTKKYNFDGWEITIDNNGSTTVNGTNTELIKQYVKEGGLNIPANGNVTCNAHWSIK